MIILWLFQFCQSVADPGFPRGGGAKPRGGAPTYYLANFSQKLHENEEISGQRGEGARDARPPLDPPLPMNIKIDNINCIMV